MVRAGLRGGACAEFPSTRAAADLLSGRPGGFGEVIFWTAIRSLFIGGVAYGVTEDAK